MRPTLNGRRLGRVLGGTLIAGGLVLAAAGIASAAVIADPAGPDSVVVSSNFNLYPQAPIPNGCNAGSAFLDGALYSVQRGSAGQAANAPPVANSNTLNEGAIGRLYPGDTITMTWVGFAPQGCNGEAIGVSLAVKSASSPSFDPSVDQALLRAFAYCGAGGTPCGGEGGAGNRLSLVMPGEDEACNYQVDAVIGGPLNVVGPAGSFYNDSTRGANGKNPAGGNRLITSNNGGPGTCESTTTTEGTTTTTEGTTTTTQGTTTTTQGTTTTLPVCTTCRTVEETTTTTAATTTVGTTAPPTTLAPATTVSRGEVPPEETVEGTTVTNPETLPVTGSSTWPAARIGIVMVLLGVAALTLSKRRSAQA